MSDDFADIWDDEEASEPTAAPVRARRPVRTVSPLWTAAREAGPPPELPVSARLSHVQGHTFREKPDGKRGCELCGAAKKAMVHHAYPASFNAGGSSKNPHTWQNEKKLWTAFFIEELERTGLPRGLGRVFVEGALTFPTKRMNRGPDQGNYRHPIEKYLGDALQDGGWLADDNWLAYQMGNLAWRYVKDVRALELTLTGFWDAEDPQETPETAAVALF
jgi:hypothetical protein